MSVQAIVAETGSRKMASRAARCLLFMQALWPGAPSAQAETDSIAPESMVGASASAAPFASQCPLCLFAARRGGAPASAPEERSVR